MTTESARVTDPRENARLFGRIAGRYDFLNRLMSLGQDLRWRDLLLDTIGDTRGPVLDVCTGTGDVGLRAAARWPGRRVLGADASLGMLRQGRGRRATPGLTGWVQADALRLPFRNGAAGAATVAFGVRNIVERGLLFAELRRVLAPGGRLAILDVFAPPGGVVGFGYRLYLRHFVPGLGRLLAGDGAAYAHLAASIRAFGRPEQLAGELEQAGFGNVSARALNLGTVGLVYGDRP